MPASPAIPMAGADVCTNACRYASDGNCDDGGPRAEHSLCSTGNDCADCGPRTPALLTPALPSPPPRTPPPQVRALEALYNATNGASWADNTGWMSGDPCADGWFNNGLDLCTGSEVTTLYAIICPDRSNLCQWHPCRHCPLPARRRTLTPTAHPPFSHSPHTHAPPATLSTSIHLKVPLQQQSHWHDAHATWSAHCAIRHVRTLTPPLHPPHPPYP